MAYSSEIADLLSSQLARFITLNRHQLAGQMANLDFWMGEVRHCLDVIDGYPRRFDRMDAAQARHVVEHGTQEFPLDDDPCRVLSPPSRPVRVSRSEFRRARSSLTEAAYRFLVRGLREGLIDEATLRQTCKNLDISVEAADLKPHP